MLIILSKFIGGFTLNRELKNEFQAVEEKNTNLNPFYRNNFFILFVIFILAMVIGGIFFPNIFKLINVNNVLRISSIIGLVALGETFVLLTGEIDISVGSIMSLSLICGTFFLKYGSMLAIIVTLAAGLFLGFINGLAVGKGKVTSLTMTLGTLSVYGGLALIISRGQASYLYTSKLYLWVGKGQILGIPFPVWLFIFFTVVCSIFLSFSKIGRYFYYTGANNIAAWCSGIRTDKIKILAFSLSGFFAAMAGPLFASQTNRITPIQGVGFELSAIAIAVLGGTSLNGGKGYIFGTFIASITYGFLLNILSLSGIGTYMEQIFKGLLLITVVLIFQNISSKK